MTALRRKPTTSAGTRCEQDWSKQSANIAGCGEGLLPSSDSNPSGLSGRLTGSETRSHTTSGAAGYRWHQQHFVTILKRISVSAQEADVFFVHIHIQEAADFSRLVAEMRFEIGELLVERGKKFSQIGCRARDLRIAGSQPAQRGRNLHCDVHLDLDSFPHFFRRIVQRPSHVLLELGELGSNCLFELVFAGERIGGLQAVAGYAEHGSLVGGNPFLAIQLARRTNGDAAR